MVHLARAYMGKTAVINVRIDPKIKEALEWCAAEDRRSVASLVEKILADWTAERGWYQPKLPKKPRTYSVPKKSAD
jgi:hypothetical protein